MSTLLEAKSGLSAVSDFFADAFVPDSPQNEDWKAFRFWLTFTEAIEPHKQLAINQFVAFDGLGTIEIRPTEEEILTAIKPKGVSAFLVIHIDGQGNVADPTGLLEKWSEFENQKAK